MHLILCACWLLSLILLGMAITTAESAGGIRSISCGPNSATLISFWASPSPTSDHVYLACADATLWWYTVSTGMYQALPPSLSTACGIAASSPDGSHLALACNGIAYGQAFSILAALPWNSTNLEILLSPCVFTPIVGIAYNDSNLVVVCGGDGGVFRNLDRVGVCPSPTVDILVLSGTETVIVRCGQNLWILEPNAAQLQEWNGTTTTDGAVQAMAWSGTALWTVSNQSVLTRHGEGGGGALSESWNLTLSVLAMAAQDASVFLWCGDGSLLGLFVDDDGGNKTFTVLAPAGTLNYSAPGSARLWMQSNGTVLVGISQGRAWKLSLQVASTPSSAASSSSLAMPSWPILFLVMPILHAGFLE